MIEPPRKGDRVRVTVEGTVDSFTGSTLVLSHKESGPPHLYYWPPADGVTVAMLERAKPPRPPEPTKLGCVVEGCHDASTATAPLVRIADTEVDRPWFCTGCGAFCSWSEITLAAEATP